MRLILAFVVSGLTGMDTNLAPELSMKNLLLYAAVLVVLAGAARVVL